MAEYITHSRAETVALGKRMAAVLAPGSLVAYTGGLGAGKTAFTRGVVSYFGLEDQVSSPTFALVHDYGGSPPLIHFDMYRISGWEDLYTTGFFDYLDAGAIVAAEWSENVEALTGAPDVVVALEALPDGSRRITVEGIGE